MEETWKTCGFPGSDGKESASTEGDLGSIPVSEDPLEKRMAPVSLPGELPGQRSLEGYCLWVCKESDTTELTNTF